jgi:outer membrane protein TolC
MVRAGSVFYYLFSPIGVDGMRLTVHSLKALSLIGASLILLSTAADGAQQNQVSYSSDPLTVEQSIAIALEESRSVLDARYALQVADRQVAEARGSAFPDLTLNAGVTKNLTPLESFIPAIIFDPSASPDDFIAVRFGADNNWTGGVTLSQPLFDYTVLIGLKVASTVRQLAVEGLRGTAQQTATAVRKAFYGVLLSRESYRLTDNSVQRLTQTLEETRARREAGFASDYDVLRLEVELGNLEPQLRRASDALEAARRGLAILMGWNADTPVTLAGSLMELDLDTRRASTPESQILLAVAGKPDALEIGFDAIVEEALNNRADIRQTRINHDLGNARIKASVSSYYPTLSGFYSYTVLAQENNGLDFFGENSNQRTTLSQAGIQLRIPLFDGFQTTARVQQEKLALLRVDTQLIQIREQAMNEVETLMDALEETKLRALAQARSVDQARRGFEIAMAQYREGVSSRLEVVDAENALRMAEFNYAQAVFDHLNAQADLDLAVGQVPLVDEVSD